MASEDMDEFKQSAAFAGGHSQVVGTASSDLEAYYKAMLEHVAEEKQGGEAEASKRPSKRKRGD